jgi:acetyltransferase-like isoleucine patch superfamily enzyme
VVTVAGALDRVGSAAVATRLRRSGVELGAGPHFFGRPVVSVATGSTLRIGARFVAISRSRDTALGVAHPLVLRTLRPGAVLEIGCDVGISGGSVCAAYRVSIGDGCLFGADTVVVDTDFHPVDHPHRRYAPAPEPTDRDAVTIGRNVFLGAGVMVLRGSWIGDGAVVGAGSVVRGRVEPGCVVAGERHRVLRALGASGSGLPAAPGPPAAAG